MYSLHDLVIQPSKKKRLHLNLVVQLTRNTGISKASLDTNIILYIKHNIALIN